MAGIDARQFKEAQRKSCDSVTLVKYLLTQLSRKDDTKDTSSALTVIIHYCCAPDIGSKSKFTKCPSCNSVEFESMPIVKNEL
jgi:hypothetical protein